MTRILIIKLRSFGDVLRTTCVLSGLHNKYSDVNIVWLSSPEALSVLENNSLINDVVSLKNVQNHQAMRKTFDFVINLEDNIAACEIVSSISTINLIGAYENDGLIYYTENSAEWFDMSLISRHGKNEADRLKKRNKRTYPRILFDMLNISPGKPLLSIPTRERTFAHQFKTRLVSNGHPIIGLNTGAGSRWQFKKLSVEKTAILADLLTDSLGASVVLFGGTAEKERNLYIQKLSKTRLIDAGNNNSLLEFSALISICDLLITSDSLALHIASCFGLPIVVFFGPTSASEIELFGPGEKIIPNMDCISCYKQNCDFNPTCMDNISAELLFETTKNLLSRTQ